MNYLCRRAAGSIGLALATSLLGGCNAILGNEDGVFVPDGATTNGSAGAGTGAAGASSTGGQGGDGVGGAGGGGGASACPEDCEEGCFEGICNGHLPVGIAAGTQVSCVIVKSGSLWCFGANRWGGLGIPPDEPSLGECTTKLGGESVPCSPTPRRVPLPGPVSKVATGFHGACAVLDDGRLFCWGDNTFGQLGHAPGQNGDVMHQGRWMHPEPIEVDVPGIESTTAVTMAGADVTSSVCASGAGGVFCWGRNEWGQLGLGKWSDTEVSPPTQIAIASGPAALVTNGGHTCAATGPLDLWCWGENSFGAAGVSKTELCTGNVACKPTPASFGAPNPIASIGVIATPRSTTCAIMNEGAARLRCAGWNGVGFLGTAWDGGVHAELAGVPGIDDDPIIDVSGGDLHVCAVKADGAVKCWGANEMGQLGNGNVGSSQTCAYGLPCEHVPQSVDLGDAKATHVRLSSWVSLALTDDGRVLAWGMNQGGQLGHPVGEFDDDAMCTGGTDFVHCNPHPRPVVGLPQADR